MFNLVIQVIPAPHPIPPEPLLLLLLLPGEAAVLLLVTSHSWHRLGRGNVIKIGISFGRKRFIFLGSGGGCTIVWEVWDSLDMLPVNTYIIL